MNFKKYLPFKNYILTTNLPIDEVKKHILENIEPRKKISLLGSNNNSTKQYEGTVEGDIFTINQIIVAKQNTFAPLITGKMSTNSNRTNIEIKMELQSFVLAFMLVWLSMAGLICASLLLGAIFNFRQLFQHGFSPMLLIPFGMFIFGCLLVSTGFKRESKRSKEFLAGLLNGQEIISAI